MLFRLLRSFSFFVLVVLLLAPPAHAKKEQAFSLAPAPIKVKNQAILKTAWSLGLKTGSQKRYYPETAQPVSDGARVFVGTMGGHFYAVDVATGKVIWTYVNQGPIAAGASLGDNSVVFADLDGRVVALDKSSGVKLWKRRFNREISGMPLVMGGTAYVMAGERELVALSLSDGHTLWQQSLESFARDITMNGQSGVATDGQNIYVGLADGHLYALNLSGGVAWQAALNPPMRNFKDIDAQVVAAGGSLYTVGYYGLLHKLGAGGGRIWQADVASGTAPLVANGTVYVSDTDGALTAFSNDSGRQLWRNELNGSVLSSAADFAGYVVVGSFKTELFVLDPSTGSALQSLSVGTGSINKPVVADNHLVVLTNGGKLIAFKKR